MKISFIIPAYNEENNIEKCIQSLIQCSSKYTYEIIVVDGGSNDNTINIIRHLQEKYSNIELLNNPYKTTPYGLNIGVKNSKGDYIFIISAHSEYPEKYTSTLIDLIEKTGADCVGAVEKIEPKKKTKKGYSIAEVLSSRIGVGNAIYRIGINKEKEVDTVAYGCYRKKVFEKYGLFNEKLTRNQDLEFNKRIIRSGGKIVLTPETYFIYYARYSFSELAKNNFGNGKWSILSPVYTKNITSQSLRHYIPFAFILSLIIPFILGIAINIKYFAISAVSLLLYFIVIFYNSIRIRIKNNNTRLVYLIFSHIVLHFSYGIGSFIGIIESLIKSKK